MNGSSAKHILPILHPPIIERPNLLERLKLVLDHKLTLVAAPPGYGKTTIIAQFAYQTTIPVAWHTLEERERDLPNLLAHCLESLVQIVPDIKELNIRKGASPTELAVFVTDYVRAN